MLQFSPICLQYGHCAADCPSHTCFKCNRKHYTSLCVNNQLQDNSSNRDQETKEKMMASFGEKSVCCPIVIVNANGIQCTALVETGAGNGYESAALINHIGTSPVRQETRQIEMLLHTMSRKIEVHNLTISNQKGSFKLNLDIHKAEKDILLIVPNPEYKTLPQSYSHLRGVLIDDDDTKAELPVHIVLGASNFSKINTNVPARIGKTGEPVAELTKFGWMIISPELEDHSNACLTQSIMHDYEQLYRLNVLGLADTSNGDQNIVYSEFKEQLQWSTQSWTRLGCHGNQNKNGSLACLSNLLSKLQHDPAFEATT